MNLSGVGSEYLRSSVEALWPGRDAHVTRRPGRGDERTWWILPSRARPRMLIPVAVPRASTMLRRHDARRSDAIARRIIETAVSTRVLRLLPVSRLHVGPGDGITEHLERLLGRPVHIGVLLGSDRANRKPVLRVFTPHGETVAFLKAAHGTVAALVRAEAESLRSIAASAERAALLEVPEVLHSGTWNELELLLLSPLAASQSRGTNDDPELAAALQVAELLGMNERSVGELVQGLRTRVDSMELGVENDRVRNHLDGLAERAGGRLLRTGSWHGDWSPWNIGRHQGRVQAWDWERFASGVPVGYDAVHHRAQLLWRGGAVPADCRPALVGAATEMLDLAEGDPTGAECVVSLYLAEVMLRYVEHRAPGDLLRPRARWVLQQLDPLSSRTKASP